jgi:glycine/D-amino acid oxidase-like deaminating enzyme
MSVPSSTKYLIIGAGIHGLSTGYHLAKELKARGAGSGADITIIDKSGVAAGASASPAVSSATTTTSRPCPS